MDTFKSFLGFGQQAAAKQMGPDPATLAAQQRQDRKLQEEEARQAREAGSRQRVINATAGRGGPVTLFRRAAPAGAQSQTLGG